MDTSLNDRAIKRLRSLKENACILILERVDAQIMTSHPITDDEWESIVSDWTSSDGDEVERLRYCVHMNSPMGSEDDNA